MRVTDRISAERMTCAQRHMPAAFLLFPPAQPCDRAPHRGTHMIRLEGDEWTIQRWVTRGRLGGEFEEAPAADEAAPALWKDLTVASAIAAFLWVAAALLLF